MDEIRLARTAKFVLNNIGDPYDGGTKPGKNEAPIKASRRGIEIPVVRALAAECAGAHARLGKHPAISRMYSLNYPRRRKKTLLHFKQTVELKVLAQLVDSLRNSNRDEYLIQPESLDGLPLHLMQMEEFERFQCPGYDRELFREMFPRLDPCWQFSRPGFNRRGNWALIAASRFSFLICEENRMYLLHREAGVWRVKDSIAYHGEDDIN